MLQSLPHVFNSPSVFGSPVKLVSLFYRIIIAQNARKTCTKSHNKSELKLFIFAKELFNLKNTEKNKTVNKFYKTIHAIVNNIYDIHHI